MKRKYRIIRDRWAGFEVQFKYWWWPFWIQAGFCNTHGSVERAEKFAAEHAKPTVKSLGYLP